MENTVFCIGVWTFLLSHVSTFDLRNRTACFSFPLMTDPPCAETEMILPRKLILGTSSNKTCHAVISNDLSVHRDINRTVYCCQLRDNDELTEYCLPSKKQQINHNSYREFVDECIGRQTCTLKGKVQPGSDYVTFQYECVPKTYVMKILENSSITDKTVFLYNDRLLPTSGRHCIAYSMDCEATITVKMVASKIPDRKCSITYSENNNQSTFSCSNPDPDGGCQPVYRSASNLVDIHINMIKSMRSRSLLWLEIEATSENVTVACGGNVPAYVLRGCPTTTITTTESTNTIRTTEATTIITSTSSQRINSPLTRIETSPTNRLPSKHPDVSTDASTDGVPVPHSHSSDVSATTDSSSEVATIIGTSIGVIAVMLLVSLAFFCYKRRLGNTGRDSLKQELQMGSLNRQLSRFDRQPMSCKNPIYENSGFHLKVGDSVIVGDKVNGEQAEYENIHIYSTIAGDKHD